MENLMISITREQSGSYMILVGNFFSFTYDGVSILGFVCGVSRYPQFYYWYLEKYRVLPRTYLGSFGGDHG